MSDLVALLGQSSLLPHARDQVWLFLGTVEPQQRLFLASYTVLSANFAVYFGNLRDWLDVREYCDDAGFARYDELAEFSVWHQHLRDPPPQLWNEDECDW